ncbi:hypothetical protein QWI17_05900 [Gilvimarinus sp. SDUM040013]|uniref:Uncharacterized protein n=1 Tax=Gilvimarinus gilvus TaxID=3058038 RepID=A0ABU4S1A1_9GAMM|nr:hypothetical protein [Gilvimarinus sp. SDUM040013]MDO3385372.1 hypothetical protein [Gilvimarinus sp. SDUM040013]MDX6850947.1 hypothetical protein [Gilvimarinus sp. SDUM040013]
MELNELGDGAGAIYDAEHICNKNEFPRNDRIAHCTEIEGESQNLWHLHNIHYAAEEEVRMGEAEYVDEITYHTVIPIHYCPFCGVALDS